MLKEIQTVKRGRGPDVGKGSSGPHSQKKKNLPV